MRSGEVAERAGVNVQTLRYYERRGLIGQPPRSLSGYRAYPAATVETVRFVKRAQELGFTREEIGDLLELAARVARRNVMRRGRWPRPGRPSCTVGSLTWSGCGIRWPS
jgi:DNA-binding transcriptional MerR regulator